MTAEQLTRLVQAAADVHGYQPTLENGEPNPMTPRQFFHHSTIQYWRRLVKDSEGRIAERAARESVTDIGDLS